VNAHLDQRVEHYGEAVDTAALVAITVHGRAQSPEWMREFLIDRVDAPGVAFLAPAAAEHTWYPGSFLQDLDDNEPWLSWALERIDRLVTELLAGGRTRERIALLGFSQGACLLAEYASRHPARYAGVAVLTGGLIGPPGTTWDGPSLDGTPMVLATSDIDEWVPLARAAETREVFVVRGADVSWTVYPGMGHVINDDEIRLVGELLARSSG
jgi:phospholipase/carboxylesterase